MIITIIAILAILSVAITFIILRSERDKKKKESVCLSQENKRLRSLVSALDNLCLELTAEKRKALDGYREVTASYTVTTSDTIKYATEEEMEAHIEKHLLKTIVLDSLRDLDFFPEVSVNAKGKKVYTYHFYFKQI